MGDFTMLFDKPRRVIGEVARRCFFKGKHTHYLARPVWDAGEAKNLADKENNHAGSY